MQDDNIHVSLVHLLVDFGRHPITIAFQNFEQLFERVHEDDLDHALRLVDTILRQNDVLKMLRGLESGGSYEMLRNESGSWIALRDDRIDKLEPLAAPVLPASIPASDLIPIYPECRSISHRSISNVRNLEYHTAEVIIPGDDSTYFFKSVNRKPIRNTIREVSSLARLRDGHPHIVPLSAFVVDDTGAVLGLLFPFAKQGNLKDAIKENTPNAIKLGWVRDIVGALIYVAESGIEYLDIKAENVVVFESGVARLTDFDGGFTEGHWSGQLECYGLGVLVEEIGCEGQAVVELAQRAKSKSMTLNQFRDALYLAIGG